MTVVELLTALGATIATNGITAPVYIHVDHPASEETDRYRITTVTTNFDGDVIIAAEGPLEEWT